jgi:iron(III) transport system permease protein
MSTSRSWLRLAQALIVLGAVLTLIVAPAWALVGALLEGGPGGLAAALGSAAWTAIGGTLWTSAVAAVLAVGSGLAAAWLTERSSAPGRRWLRLGMLLPLALPAIVSAVGWADAYGPGGLLEALTGRGLPGLFSAAGMVAVMSATILPVPYALIAAGLATRGEPDLERAARASGAGPWTVFRTVTLPLLRPTLAVSTVLAFVLGVNAFDVPVVLGLPSGFATMTTGIYSDLVLSADPRAFERVLLLAGLLALLAGGVAFTADTFASGLPIGRTGSPPGAPYQRRRTSVPSMAAALLGWAWIGLASAGPLAALLLTALSRAVGVSPLPSHWTLRHFSAALGGSTVPALLHTLGLSLAAACLALLLGGLLVALPRGRLARLSGSLATVGLALPGSALAVAVLLAYGGSLRDSVAIILVAYLAKFWTLGHRPLAAAADRLPADLLRAARASGAGAVATVRTIVAPLLFPAVVAAWALVFLFSMHELTMSSLLYGPGNETLAVRVLDLQQLGDPTVTAALALILASLSAVALVPIGLIVGRGRPRRVDR